MDDLEDAYPNLDHWKTVSEFTVEQAALLMAMIDPLEMDLHKVRYTKHPRWKKAHGNELSIISAIRQGLISPVVCRTMLWQLDQQGFEGFVPVSMEPSDREMEISSQHTIITRASLKGWAKTHNVEIVRPPRPSPPAPSSSMQMTQTSEPYHFDVVPKESNTLTLPFHGHKSEGLELVDEAIQQFWKTFDPDDPSTAPTKEEVTKWLEAKRGASGRMAQAIDMILRPFEMRKARLKNRVHTRAD